jgi:dihydropyrimidine dehydrogenase (NAD+) subunit PreA
LPSHDGEGLGSDVGENPELVSLYTKATRKGTHLPILVKMTSNVRNIVLPPLAAMESGATGLAAINTIKSIMNINIDDFESKPCVGENLK